MLDVGDPCIAWACVLLGSLQRRTDDTSGCVTSISLVVQALCTFLARLLGGGRQGSALYIGAARQGSAAVRVRLPPSFSWPQQRASM